MMFYEIKADPISLLPQRLQQVEEFGYICSAAGSELDKGNGIIAQAARDSFIATAGEEGLHRWESILGVSAPLYSTVESRREALLARLMTKPPINIAVLKGIIETFMGVEADISIDLFTVKVSYRGESRVQDLTPLFVTLYDTIPANMLLEIGYKYIVWNELDSLLLSFDGLDSMDLGWQDFEKGEWING